MADTDLLRVLERARELGFLGPGPVAAHIEQARAYLAALPAGGTVLDLGTGGGVPGLPLATWRSDLRWVLIDAMAKRIAFVRWAVEDLGVHAEVVEGRAEELAAETGWRAGADAVVARSLAAPAVAAEYAAPLLRVGGVAVIAEPPGGAPERWPAAGLAQLGMRRGRVLATEGTTLQLLEQVEPCPAKFPRRTGVAAKRPLF
ncbi:MAG TPA: RsmG family class I SAM-dependent methyltransferase [Acidimicrobiales bacterium]|nr:RsmG family class I SAM-dependent methyltransferase [Acidimicrobiales bacterium]